MQYLADNDYSVISLQQSLDYLKGLSSLPDRAVLLTFDDGYRSVHDIAAPIMEEYGFSYVIFVNPALVGSNKNLYLNWSQLNRLAKKGAAIANHSLAHPSFLEWRELPEDDFQSKIYQQVIRAESIIAERTGHHFKVLAYPYGEFDLRTQKWVAANQFIAFGQHSGPLDRQSDHTALPRFPMGAGYGKKDDFLLKLDTGTLQLNSATVVVNGQIVKDTWLHLKTGFKSEIYLQLDQANSGALNCFFNGIGPIEPVLLDNSVRFAIKANLKRHNRFNCTRKVDGRWLWSSIPLFNVAEPVSE
jgi:peptidoglycan/xylan/chitin deacetylase (PgdA/CDA1 family)